jgi:hypothetical protein
MICGRLPHRRSLPQARSLPQGRSLPRAEVFRNAEDFHTPKSSAPPKSSATSKSSATPKSSTNKFFAIPFDSAQSILHATQVPEAEWPAHHHCESQNPQAFASAPPATDVSFEEV